MIYFIHYFHKNPLFLNVRALPLFFGFLYYIPSQTVVTPATTEAHVFNYMYAFVNIIVMFTHRKFSVFIH